MNKGKLYLIPCGLGGDNEMAILPEETRHTTHALTHFVVEREKTARHFLKRIEYPKPLNDLQLYPLNKHTQIEDFSQYLSVCEQGIDLGLISEAGCPAVADPGAVIVEQAHKKNIEVVPLVGPSSILMALMASGMSGQSFVFHGYIPKDKNDRSRFIKQMESDARSKKQSQIFMETPFRNAQILEEVIRFGNPTTRLCIATNITTDKARIKPERFSNGKTKNLILLNNLRFLY